MPRKAILLDNSCTIHKVGEEVFVYNIDEIKKYHNVTESEIKGCEFCLREIKGIVGFVFAEEYTENNPIFVFLNDEELQFID